MKLDEAYRQIEKRLERMDFSALYRGFHPFPFALYNDAQAYMNGAYMEKPDNFMGNTSVVVDGVHTAIWKLTDISWDMDVLTSKLVHEMLHAYQNASGETRWADERAALVKYRYEPVNFAARMAEADCMRLCLRENTPDAFSRLLALRRARQKRFPFAYDYEARIEQIEGTAHFVELKALAQLDAKKARQRWESLLEELSDPAKYFPVRIVTYLSGAAFLACLRKYTDVDTDAFTDTPFAVLALDKARPGEKLPDADDRVTASLTSWQKERGEVVKNALQKGNVTLQGTCRLMAWNIYDASWDGRYAIINSFLGYIEGTELPETDEELFAQMKMLNGDFVAEVDENLCVSCVWRQ